MGMGGYGIEEGRRLDEDLDEKPEREDRRQISAAREKDTVGTEDQGRRREMEEEKRRLVEEGRSTEEQQDKGGRRRGRGKEKRKIEERKRRNHSPEEDTYLIGKPVKRRKDN